MAGVAGRGWDFAKGMFHPQRSLTFNFYLGESTGSRGGVVDRKKKHCFIFGIPRREKLSNAK